MGKPTSRRGVERYPKVHLAWDLFARHVRLWPCPLGLAAIHRPACLLYPMSMLFVALVTTTVASPPVTINVSPRGDDADPGTTDKPVKTLHYALKLAKKQGDRPVRIVLGGGDYYLDGPLHVDRSDTEFRAKRGESPVLIAGTQITGFQSDGGPYTVTLPGSFPVTQLFVNGVRYNRPRLPESGYYHVKAAIPDQPQGDDRCIGQPGTIDPGWHAFHEVEVLAFQNWTMTRFPIKAFDTGSGTLSFFGRTVPADWHRFKPGLRYVVENVREALRKPGQFYFDSATRKLSVIPMRQKDNPLAQVVVPRFEQVVVVGGTPEKRITNVKFDHVTFAYAAWGMGKEGRNTSQAEVDLPGAVQVHDARAVSFTNCRITKVGGYGLEIGANAQDVSYVDGEISDLGAGGVKVGLAKHVPDDDRLTSRVTIARDVIAGGGRVHPAGVGVWVGDSPDVSVIDCEIADFYYSGVSVGWTWGYGPTNTRRNHVTGNHIHDIGYGVLSDMGGVYHLGTDDHCIVDGNRIHDVTSFSYGGWGLYLDEGSTGVTMADNVVYGCSAESFHQHYGKENVVRNNILVDGHEAQIARTRAEDHLSFTFTGNIVVWPGPKPLLWGNWDGDGVSLDGNLYWRSDGKPVTFGKLSVAQWQASGRDKHSLFVDPGFVDAGDHDYRLRPGSPALALGFKPMDPVARPWPTRWANLPRAWPSGK